MKNRVNVKTYSFVFRILFVVYMIALYVAIMVIGVMMVNSAMNCQTKCNSKRYKSEINRQVY